MLRSLLVLSFLVNSAMTVTAQECSICGEGKQVGNPDALFSFLQMPQVLCRILEQQGKEGLIPVDECSLLPDMVGICECEPSPESPVLSSPTAAPIGLVTTLAPIVLSTLSPVTPVAPVTPVSAPVGLPASDKCSVCGDDKQVGDPNALFMFPNQPSVPCGLLQQAGDLGTIPSNECERLPLLLVRVCDCVPVTMAPVAPVVATMAPSFAPVTIAPIAPPDTPSPRGSTLPSSVPSDIPSGDETATATSGGPAIALSERTSAPVLVAPTANSGSPTIALSERTSAPVLVAPTANSGGPTIALSERTSAPVLMAPTVVAVVVAAPSVVTATNNNPSASPVVGAPSAVSSSPATPIGGGGGATPVTATNSSPAVGGAATDRTPAPSVVAAPSYSAPISHDGRKVGMMGGSKMNGKKASKKRKASKKKSKSDKSKESNKLKKNAGKKGGEGKKGGGGKKGGIDYVH